MTQPEDVSDKIALIMGQTNYSADDASVKLKLKNYDEIAVIREYLGSTGDSTINETPSSTTTSKNQLIYAEIRKFMDGCVRADPDKANSADNTTY